jgi:uncharacterized protein YciI
MFIVQVESLAPLAEIDIALDTHRHWLFQHYAEGIFLASGPTKPRTGGVILAAGTTLPPWSSSFVLTRSPNAVWRNTRSPSFVRRGSVPASQVRRK